MKLIRYPDLVAKGVVNSRMTLKRLIDMQGFPRRRIDHAECSRLQGRRGRHVDCKSAYGPQARSTLAGWSGRPATPM